MKKPDGKIRLMLLGAVLILGVLYVKEILSVAATVLRALSPVFIGIVFALFLNILLKFFENKLLNKLRSKKIKRALGIFLTYSVFLGVVAGLVVLMLPHIIKSISSLAERIPAFVSGLPDKLYKLAAYLKIPDSILDGAIDSLQNSASGISQGLINALPHIVEFSKNLFKSLYNFFIGLALSGFFLACKEKLSAQAHKILTALSREKTAEKLERIAGIANRKISKFVAGQTFECLVVGIACFLGMTVFKIPYAALVSVIIGITNFIPIIGPIIGIIPSALIIMIDSPIKALYFLIIENVVQQLESTFLYPKVVGGKLGISGLWVFASVVILGNLFGFVGMFLGVPLFACLYTVISEIVKDKLAEKKLGEGELILK